MLEGILVVDVQPAYHKWCKAITKEVATLINKSTAPVCACWVGYATTSDTEDSVREYLQNAGAYSNKLDACTFLEKSFGFFGPWMDNNVAYSDIVQVAKALLTTKAYDSAEIDIKHIPKYLQVLASTRPIEIPAWDLSILSSVARWKTCGGGRTECLAEIELLLDVLGVSFSRIPNLDY